MQNQVTVSQKKLLKVEWTKMLSADNAMHLTELEKQNLARFGCTFKERGGVFFIDWRGRSVRQASEAEIYARVAKLETELGPLILLAFEISPVRPVPHYCYFPFDLRSQAHRRYLSHLIQTGEIDLCFIGKKATAECTHQLTPFLRSRGAEVYADVVQDFEQRAGSAYDFEGVVRVLEQWVRIPQLLEHFLSPDDLAELSRRIEDAVRQVANERREAARRIVREAVEAFKPYYEGKRKQVVENFQRIRMGLLFMLDFDVLFAGNPEGFINFLGDGIAGSFSPEDLESLSELQKIAVSLPKLPFRGQVEPETGLTVPRVPAGLTNLVELMAMRGISPQSLGRFFELVGLEIGGKPGRPTKDYSREYELKMSGLSWSEVARHAVGERSDLRKEFGGLDYDSLDRIKQQQVWNRIRQGVTGYAKRTGKPLPSEVEAEQE